MTLTILGFYFGIFLLEVVIVSYTGIHTSTNQTTASLASLTLPFVGGIVRDSRLATSLHVLPERDV